MAMIGYLRVMAWVWRIKSRSVNDGETAVEARRDDGALVVVEGASPIRRTWLARLMGDRRPGYVSAIESEIEHFEEREAA